MLRNPKNSNPTSPQSPPEKNRELFAHVSREIITNSQMQD